MKGSKYSREICLLLNTIMGMAFSNLKFPNFAQRTRMAEETIKGLSLICIGPYRRFMRTDDNFLEKKENSSFLSQLLL